MRPAMARSTVEARYRGGVLGGRLRATASCCRRSPCHCNPFRSSDGGGGGSPPLPGRAWPPVPGRKSRSSSSLTAGATAAAMGAVGTEIVVAPGSLSRRQYCVALPVTAAAATVTARTTTVVARRLCMQGGVADGSRATGVWWRGAGAGLSGARSTSSALRARDGGSGAGAAVEAHPPSRMEEPSTALLLAWFACGNRSLFAARCLVEVLVELYREGRTFGELQLSLKMVAQGGRMRRRRGSSGVRATPAAAAAAADGSASLDAAAAGEADEDVAVSPPLLQGQEEDVLVSWMALVLLTCEELGVLRDREPRELRQQEQQEAAVGGGDSMAAGNTYLRGMLGYVRQTLGMYDEGQTLARVAGLQGLVQQSSGAASSPFLVLMQQYTRLVLLTVEVVAAARLATARPLRPPETVPRPSGYSRAFSGACNAALLDAENKEAEGKEAEEGEELCPARGLAVRLLMAFMGAVLGSQWSLLKFVEAVRVAYDQGLAADELFQQLDEQEFVQSGGLLPIAGAPAAASRPVGMDDTTEEPFNDTAATGATAPPPPLDAVQGAAPSQPAPQYLITKALLSTWISLSYMTLAQLAVPYPEAGQRLGWAWAGFGDPIEALGMNDFVGNVLRQMAGEDPRVVPQQELSPPPSPAATTMDSGSAADPDQAVPVSVGSAAGREAADDSDGIRTRNRRMEGALMVRVEDETLPATSTAVRVLTQQVALVQAVCRQVMLEECRQ